MADDKNNQASQEAEAFKLKDEKDSYKFVMESRLGRIFVKDLLEACNVYTPVFDANVNIMIMKEGKRNVGLGILARIDEHVPSHYLTLLKEHNPHQKSAKKKKPK